MFDIPNIVSLPLELAVALLILMMDQRQRKRETEDNHRFQEQQKVARENEIRSRERFNNWQQEHTKRQMMMLEAIMATLDSERADFFQQEVGSRYAREISQDMQDLDELLDKQKASTETDPELEADIESKLDEIESAKDFIKNFLPTDVITEISDIATTAKSAYESLRDLPEKLTMDIPDMSKVEIKVDNQTINVDPKNASEVDELKILMLKSFKAEQKRFIRDLNKSIKETIDGVKLEINQTDDSKEKANNIVESMKSTLQASGLGDLVNKAKQMANNMEDKPKNEKDKKE